MQFRYYPADHQTCSIFLISFGFTEDVLKFVWSREVRLRPEGLPGIIKLSNYLDLEQLSILFLNQDEFQSIYIDSCTNI